MTEQDEAVARLIPREQLVAAFRTARIMLDRIDAARTQPNQPGAATEVAPSLQTNVNIGSNRKTPKRAPREQREKQLT